MMLHFFETVAMDGNMARLRHYGRASACSTCIIGRQRRNRIRQQKLQQGQQPQLLWQAATAAATTAGCSSSWLQQQPHGIHRLITHYYSCTIIAAAAD
jgi:hypothetical protein